MEVFTTRVWCDSFTPVKTEADDTDRVVVFPALTETKPLRTSLMISVLFIYIGQA